MNDMSTIIPKDYKSSLNVIDTQIAIKKLKDFFEMRLKMQKLFNHLQNGKD